MPGLCGAGRDPAAGGGRRPGTGARTRGWPLSARRPAPRRTRPAGRSSARPVSCSTSCCRTPAWPGPRSPCSTSSSAGRRATAGRPATRSPAAARTWSGSSACCSPRLVVALGLTAVAWFLGGPGGRRTTLAAARGTVHEARGYRVIATYHPSAAIRFGPAGAPLAALREDLDFAARVLAGVSGMRLSTVEDTRAFGERLAGVLRAGRPGDPHRAARRREDRAGAGDRRRAGRRGAGHLADVRHRPGAPRRRGYRWCTSTRTGSVPSPTRARRWTTWTWTPRWTTR